MNEMVRLLSPIATRAVVALMLAAFLSVASIVDVILLVCVRRMRPSWRC